MKPLMKKVIEILLVVFLLYINVLMGAFVSSKYGSNNSLLLNMAYIFTFKSLFIAIFGAIIYYVVLNKIIFRDNE